PWEVRGSVSANVTTAVIGDLEPTTQYFFRVRAINNAGYSLYSNEAGATTMTQFTVTFQSSRGADGFVMERTEQGNIGQLAVADFTGPGALRAGDTAANQQYKAFVSFNTSAIPDDAIVRAAKLRLRRGMVVGTNPFWTHGLCVLDMKGGAGFSGNPVLQPSDFQAPAHQRLVGVLNNGAISEAVIALSAISLVNKIGVTQFRIYFKSDDNNDRRADWVGWYSSESTEPSYCPTFEVTYWH
ncbi:MAG TPA: hypothetical protein VJ063_07085, partial [Verrucomicrobiae bacterium]|nr:hypothetical protein [Verrucomicrobiae bacterium]